MIEERYMDREELTQPELDAIDKNWKTIIKLANKVLDDKPQAEALRMIEAYLERIGVSNFHSGAVAATVQETLKKVKTPKTDIMRKVKPKLDGGEKGSGYYPAGSAGMSRL